MAPLTYSRLIKGLTSLAEKANADLQGAAFEQHRDEILQVVDMGLKSIQQNLLGGENGLSPGQIKHMVGDKVDEILEGVTPPSPPTSLPPTQETVTPPAQDETPANVAPGSDLVASLITKPAARSTETRRGRVSGKVALGGVRKRAAVQKTRTNLSMEGVSFAGRTSDEIQCAISLVKLSGMAVVFAQ